MPLTTNRSRLIRTNASPVFDDLDKLLPDVRSGGLIIAHNINPRMADPKYMEAITTDPNPIVAFSSP